MNAGLRSLLRTVRARSPAAPTAGAPHYAVSLDQVVSYTDLLFPANGHSFREALSGEVGQRAGKDGRTRQRQRPLYEDPAVISPGWQDALHLLELAAYAPPSEEPTRGQTPPAWEQAVAEYVLNVARFPNNPQAARLAVAVLDRWRALEKASGDSGALFPSSLTARAGGRLAYQISQCSPSERPRAWQEALEIYQHIARQHTAVLSGGPPASGSSDAKHMASVRHTVLVTLLRSGAWEEALRFFKHTLYQRDMPDSVSTGFLLQSLGKAGRVDDVRQVYRLCVKLLTAITRQHQGNPSAQAAAYQQRLRKQWGTTLSMAMAVVCERDHEQLIPLLEQLLSADTGGGSGKASTAAAQGPLVLLDGNFLSAVQQSPRQEVRRDALEKARRAGLLDFFKLIRGLASRKQMDEALAVFTEGVTSTPPLLSRKEIGASRIFLLNGATFDNVERVACAMHRALRRNVPALRMNDSEVEAVLAKSVGVPAKGGAAADRYWAFSLQLWEENYAAFLDEGGGHPRRRPSLASLSFLLHNPQLSWDLALRLVRRLDGLPPTHSRHAGRSTHEEGSGREDRRVPAQALILNSASALLLAQGHPAEAEELSLTAITAYAASPSAEFLLRCEEATLRRLVLRDGVPVDPKVLFHILRETKAAAPMTETPRSLLVMSLLMARVCPALPRWAVQTSPPSLPKAGGDGALQGSPSWLAAVPASVHCEALSCVRRCITDPARRWQLTASYLDFLQLPTTTCGAQHHGDRQRADLLKSYYSAIWEAVLTMVDTPAEATLSSTTSTTNREREAHEQKLTVVRGALARATVGCDFLPPGYMFLPNQMDRLLPPPLSVSRSGSGPPQYPDGDDSEGSRLFCRCCAAQDLVLLSYRLLQQRYDERPATTAPSKKAAVEPVVLHGLLKLCCRVGEYATSFSPSQRRLLDELLHRDMGPSVSRASLAAQLLDWQATHNGLSTVSPQSVHLLYSLCAAASDKAPCDGGGGDGQGARTALRATERLLRLSAAQSESALLLASRELRAARSSLRRLHRDDPRQGPVLPAHHMQFHKLFGWELGLSMWYEAFPKETLLAVSRSPVALNYCLSLGERNDPAP